MERATVLSRDALALKWGDMDGKEAGSWLTLGDSDGLDVGLPLLVGLALGRLDGIPLSPRGSVGSTYPRRPLRREFDSIAIDCFAGAKQGT